MRRASLSVGAPRSLLAQAVVLLELFHDLLEIPSTGCGVDGGRLQPLMTQECGHAHQISPAIQRVLAKAVAGGVGRDVLKASQARRLADQQLHGAGADALPALTEEQLISGDG